MLSDYITRVETADKRVKHPVRTVICFGVCNWLRNFGKNRERRARPLCGRRRRDMSDLWKSMQASDSDATYDSDDSTCKRKKRGEKPRKRHRKDKRNDKQHKRRESKSDHRSKRVRRRDTSLTITVPTPPPCEDGDAQRTLQKINAALAFAAAKAPLMPASPSIGPVSPRLYSASPKTPVGKVASRPTASWPADNKKASTECQSPRSAPSSTALPGYCITGFRL